MFARIVLVAGLAAASAASAHSELRSAEWCAGGIVHYRGEFAFTHDQLQAEMQRNATRRCASGATSGAGGAPDIGSPTGTCGVFDPPYETAVMMARTACGGTASAGNAPDNGSTVAFVSEPQSFNDPDHHETFNFDAGLRGMCGICVMPVAAPDPILPAAPGPGAGAPPIPPRN